MTREDLFRYAQDTYGTEPEYLWKSSPDYAVLRHVENPKWYGIVMYVECAKLGIDGEGMVDILDVKCDPMQLEFLCRQPGFLPGYHMNHRQWLTVLLDGTVPDDQILDLLDQSYTLTDSFKKTHSINKRPAEMEEADFINRGIQDYREGKTRDGKPAIHEIRVKNGVE